MSMLSAQGHTGHSQDLQPPNRLGNQCPGMQASQAFSSLLIMRPKLEVGRVTKTPDSLSGQWWDGNYSYSHGNTHYCFRKWSSFLQVGGLAREGFQRELGQESQWFPSKANSSLRVEKIREKPLMTRDQNPFAASSLHYPSRSPGGFACDQIIDMMAVGFAGSERRTGWVGGTISRSSAPESILLTWVC